MSLLKFRCLAYGLYLLKKLSTIVPCMRLSASAMSEPHLPEKGRPGSYIVTHWAKHITRPYHLHWGDREMGLLSHTLNACSRALFRKLVKRERKVEDLDRGEGLFPGQCSIACTRSA